MRERPILFSAPMVRAILADEKTMTRRIVRWTGDRSGDGPWDRAPWKVHHDGHEWRAEWRLGAEDAASSRCRQPAVVGDLLWVREAWGPCDVLAYGEVREDPVCVRYAADGTAWIHEHENHQPLCTTGWPDGPDGGRWRPSIHMPRWASRISLEVTSIAVQRLQAITPADVLAEGFGHDLANRMAEDGEAVEAIDAALLDAWATGWDGINGHRAAWASDPWVWVVGFKRVKP
jgi:hypothetical protein